MDSVMLFAIEAALAAGKDIMEIYDRNDYEVEIKSDNSPLTEADNASNNIINDILKTNTSFPIVSEENDLVSYEERKDWQQYWLIDPLDGTKEFIKRNGEFTVNIALIENGKPYLGVVYVPVTKELYYANVAKKIACKIVVSDYSEISDLFCKESTRIHPQSVDGVIRVVGSRSHMNEETEAFISTLKTNYPNKEIEIIPTGSSLKLCLLAEGKADYYPRFAPTMEWDTAAGQAVCEAVGVRVIDQNTMQTMGYNKPNLLNSYFLAQN